MAQAASAREKSPRRLGFRYSLAAFSASAQAGQATLFPDGALPSIRQTWQPWTRQLIEIINPPRRFFD